MYVAYFLKILWVGKNWNMVNIRTTSSIDSNLSVQSGDIQILMSQKKKYLDVFIYINNSKVYHGESSFIFH